MKQTFEEAVRSLYSAITRNEISTALLLFDSRIERIEPEGFPSAGTYFGVDEVGRHLSKGRESWAEGVCEPEQMTEAGDKVVVFLHVRVRMTGSESWVKGRFADVLTFRDGKIIQMRTFADRTTALKWAGVRV